MALTAVAKEYLVAIYTLAQEGKPVIGARLAERLRVTPPTVTQTLRRLERDGLVRQEARQGLVLTDQGRAEAEEALRRQRLSERWLVETLGLNWAEAHEAARAMEAAISPSIAERLDAILGHPTDAVHGAVEGPAGQVVVEPVLLSLDRVEPGAVVMLERIADDEEHARELLAYLDRHGLRPGIRVVVTEVQPWAQTLTLSYRDQRIILGTSVARHIWVRQLSPEDIERALHAEQTECPDEAGFVAEVADVGSDCPAGHQIGDRFAFGQRTPCGMCGEAFVEIHQHLERLRERAARERNAQVVVACPEHGNVKFRVRPAHLTAGDVPQ